VRAREDGQHVHAARAGGHKAALGELRQFLETAMRKRKEREKHG
jgi:hypothetical protein